MKSRARWLAAFAALTLALLSGLFTLQHRLESLNGIAGLIQRILQPSLFGVVCG